MLEYAVDNILLGARLLEHIEQPHEIWIVGQLLEYRDFPHGGVINTIGHILKLNWSKISSTYLEQKCLQSHNRICWLVDGFEHFPVGPLSELSESPVLAKLCSSELDCELLLQSEFFAHVVSLQENLWLLL